MGPNTTKVTDANFDATVQASKPTLVDFWAEWCGPCRVIEPILDQMAAEKGDKLTVAKLNVDENPQTAMHHDVMSIPTLILFRDGVEKKRLVGARSRAQLERELAEFLA